MEKCWETRNAADLPYSHRIHTLSAHSPLDLGYKTAYVSALGKLKEDKTGDGRVLLICVIVKII
jgi:hypothetical protein